MIGVIVLLKLRRHHAVACERAGSRQGRDRFSNRLLFIVLGIDRLIVLDLNGNATPWLEVRNDDCRHDLLEQ